MNRSLIIKYLQKKCSAEESHQVYEWLHSESFEADLLDGIEEELKIDLLNESIATGQADFKRMLKDIYLKDEIHNLENHVSYKKASTISVRENITWYLKIAASLAILIVSGIFVVNNFTSEPKTINQIPSTPIIEKEISPGRKSTILLSDGSTIYLNGESKIQYQEHFTETSREIYLKGEAFFEVAEDPNRPFTVYVDDISVTALGTSFNINTFDRDQVAIALATGKIVVRQKENQEIYLNQGQQVSYIKHTNKFSEIAPLNPKAAYGWKDGILYFRRADQQKVFSQIERWFGVDFIAEGNIREKWSFTGEFHNQTLKSVMESLSFSQNFHYEIEGKEVIIK
ncbi:MAG: FecR family protein [Candidatus Cyclobacteriaceae bacterium M3_2C_046]